MKMITAPQLKFVKSLAAERGVELSGVEGWTCRQASAKIDELKSMARPVAAPAAHSPVAGLVGTYTAVFEDGSRTTFRIANEGWCDGKTVASVMTGPDNELSFTGVGFVVDGEVRTWGKRRGSDLERRLLEAIAVATANTVEAKEQFLQTAEAFALRSGKCVSCGHKLTVPASLFRGLGPVCAKREGL
jgi:hypothetical protein